MDDIEQQVQTVLDADPAIKAYCEEKFTRLPYVYVGLDPNEPPPKECMPAFSIFESDTEYAGDRNKDFVKIGVLVNSDAKETLGYKVTFAGWVHAKRLMNLAKKALLKSNLGKVSLKESGTLRSEVNPVWFSYLVVEIENIEPYYEEQF